MITITLKVFFWCWNDDDNDGDDNNSEDDDDDDVGDDDSSEDGGEPETQQRRLMFLPSSSATEVSTTVSCLITIMMLMKKRTMMMIMTNETQILMKVASCATLTFVCSYVSKTFSDPQRTILAQNPLNKGTPPEKLPERGGRPCPILLALFCTMF